MSRIQVVLLASVALQLASGDFIPLTCYNENYLSCSQEECERVHGQVSQGGVSVHCRRKRVQATLQPLDGKCQTFQLEDGFYKCQSVIRSVPVDDYLECGSLCARDTSCKSYIAYHDGRGGKCDICSSYKPLFDQNLLFVAIAGSKNCLDCIDLGISVLACDQVQGCTYNTDDAVCERQCSIRDANPDGTCDNFCIKERMQCETEDNFHAKDMESVEVCQNTVPLGIDAFDFNVLRNGKCSLCKSDQLIQQTPGPRKYFYAGRRTCNPTTTTTQATTVSTTVSAVLPASTLAPSESMTGDVTASQAIAQRLMASRTPIRAEVTDAAEENQAVHSGITFIGGLVGGVTATLLVFVAKRRYASVGSSDVAE